MKFSRQELATIRQVAITEAKRWSRARRFFIEVGERFNTDDANIPMSINIAAVTKHPDWEDTDLNQTRSWDEMKKPYELVDGRAVFDFYIYENEKCSGDLVCNVQALCDIDGLFRMNADLDKSIWTR